MSETHTALEVIDLCSSDDEVLEDQGSGGRVSLDRMGNSGNTNNVSSTCNDVVNVINSSEIAYILPDRKRAAEIDLTEDSSGNDHADENNLSSIHLDNAKKMPRQKKFRGGGQGSSRDTQNEVQEHVTVSSAASSASSSSFFPTAATSLPATTPQLSSTIRIVLEKDKRVKDTGLLQEGMMDLLCQLNQTSNPPFLAKLCTRHHGGDEGRPSATTASATNPYAKRKSQTATSAVPSSTVRWIQQHENWSCGYRSLQMVLTALLPRLPIHHAYYQVVPRRGSYVAIPSLGQIQSTLEQAWKEGYDPQGARHYQRRILGKTGKSGELGALEISSVMAYWGLDATVIQFITCHQSRRLLPIFVKSYFAKALGKEDCPCCCGAGDRGGGGSIKGSTAIQSGDAGKNITLDSAAMANKLLQFAEASLSIEETCDCPVLPLYLQWEGHAVTIVGYHEQNDRFLVFDPRKKAPRNSSQQQQIQPPKHLWSTFQLDPEYLRNRDTQVIIASYQSLSPTKKESRRQQLEVVTAAEADVLRAVAASQS
ncbi:unnamed protein product [Cylindrotheca closterium]|uniref:UFSP1/2/DUB catalytic domain-containing protein n=1 Tax=Cylindrotheca closterium TaxID=2856 RepID=A0AAD2FF81_9STRA|nr:unnamed protein product [Cylindrotheca closterium]